MEGRTVPTTYRLCNEKEGNKRKGVGFFLVGSHKSTLHSTANKDGNIADRKEVDSQRDPTLTYF